MIAQEKAVERSQEYKIESSIISKILRDAGLDADSLYVPVKQAAKYLLRSEREIRYLCNEGHFGTKAGIRNWIITRDELITVKLEDKLPKVGRPRTKIVEEVPDESKVLEG